MNYIEKLNNEFDKKFPGLKSVGHGKIHYERPKHNEGEVGHRCDDRCIYVNLAIKSFYSTKIHELLEEVINDFTVLVAEEANIARSEGQATSRLTSLHNRFIKKLKEIK